MKLKTLRAEFLSKLFEKPSCIKKSKLIELKPIIFPNEETFIRFLKSTNTQEQQKLAKNIIERLLYDIRFFIPHNLISNVFSFEEAVKPIVKKSHLTRDHYVHLVLSYIQGVYLFFYVDTFRIRLLEEMASLKLRFNSKTDNNLPETLYEDSVFCLKILTLAHDLGYPFEQRAYNKGEDDYKNFHWNDYLQIYGNLKKTVADELAYRMLSRSIAIQYLGGRKGKRKGANIINYILNNIHQYKLKTGDSYQDYNDEKLAKYIKMKYKKSIDSAERIPRLRSRYGTQLVASILKRECLLAVLMEDEIPIALILPKDKSKKDDKIKILHNAIKLTTGRMKQKDLLHMAFTARTTFNRKQRWHYYAIDFKNNINTFISNVYTMPQGFNSVAKKFISNIGPVVPDDEKFPEICFQIYTSLKSITDKWGDLSLFNDYKAMTDLSDSEFRVSLNSGLLRLTYKVCLQETATVLKNQVGEEISRVIDSLDYDDRSIGQVLAEAPSKNPPGELIDRFVQDVINMISPITRKIANNVWSDLSSTAMNNNSIMETLALTRRYFYKNITTTFKSFVNQKNVNVTACLDKISTESDFEDHIYSQIKTKLSKSGSEGEKHDHGLASLCIVFYLAKLHSAFFSKCNGCFDSSVCETDDDALALSLGLGTPFDVTQYDFQLKYLLPSICKSISLHNLNLNKLSLNKIEFDKDPLTYFFIFNDELQTWERQVNASLSNIDNIDAFYMDKCFIYTKKNVLYLSFRKGSIDLKNKIDEVINAMNEKLFHPNTFIRHG